MVQFQPESEGLRADKLMLWVAAKSKVRRRPHISLETVRAEESLLTPLCYVQTVSWLEDTHSHGGGDNLGVPV